MKLPAAVADRNRTPATAIRRVALRPGLRRGRPDLHLVRVKMRKKLTEQEIARDLGALAGWSRAGDALRRTFKLASFAEAIAFVNRVAAAAESMDHHPDIDIRYDRVSFTLSTHSAGGLTPLDFELARRIDGALA